MNTEFAPARKHNACASSLSDMRPALNTPWVEMFPNKESRPARHTMKGHFDEPDKSSILSKYPKFLANHHAVHFLSDSIKVIMTGGISPHDLETLMEQDLEVRHHDECRPAATLAKVADELNIEGIHLFTFNNIADTAEWQRKTVGAN